MKRTMKIAAGLAILLSLLPAACVLFQDGERPAADGTAGPGNLSARQTGQPTPEGRLRSAGEAESQLSWAVEQPRISRKVFHNYADGYAFILSGNMTVDMSAPEVRSVFENQDVRIEIYRQPINEESGVRLKEYRLYSNRFLEADPHVTIRHSMTIGWHGANADLMVWEREPLKYVANDRRHYGSVEISRPDLPYVYTMLIKSSRPLIRENGRNEYLDHIKNFYITEITREPSRTSLGPADPSRLSQEAREVLEQYFSSDSSLTWGIFEPEAPLSMKRLRQLEQEVSYEFPILLYYTGIIEDARQHPRLERALRNAKAENRLLELTLQTYPGQHSDTNMIYDVLNGKYDAFLQHYAQTVAESGIPVLFRPGNEMNGDWCAYSAIHTARDTEIFKAFYRHIYEVFDRAGADNVLWIWNPNTRSFPDFKWNHELCYYPGDAYVDIVGLTAYNTGTYYAGEYWESFEALYGEACRRYAETYAHPLMITEFASSSIGGDKLAWTREMFRVMARYDRIKVAVWWDSCDYDSEGNVSRSYFIDEPPEMLDLFRQELRQTN